MLKLLLFCALLPVVNHAMGQRILVQDYNFIGRGQLAAKLHQSHDTLYYLQCFPGLTGKQGCITKPQAHYKIISSSKIAEFQIVKLEQLDTLSLTSNPYPETRFSLLILAAINDKGIGWLPRRQGSTKSQIDTARINLKTLRNNFYFTYFSDAYLGKLMLLKKIATKQDADNIMLALKDAVGRKEIKELVEKYEKTQPIDYYGSGMTSELITRFCIEKGYSPVNAQQLLADSTK
jgi:hypothetical protein